MIEALNMDDELPIYGGEGHSETSPEYGFWFIMVSMMICSVVGVMATCREIWRYLQRRMRAPVPRVRSKSLSTEPR